MELEEEFLSYLLRSESIKRRDFFNKFLGVCQPEDIMFVSKRLDEFKNDFFTILPNEILEIILENLDWKSLLNCCMVSKTWNEKISTNFNRLWYTKCVDELPLNKLNNIEYSTENYKLKFISIMNQTHQIDKNFCTTSFGPVEIEAISIYKDIIATATHEVKFWVYNGEKWDYNRKLQLQSRVQQFKFNSKYLVTSTYFLTVDLYSLETNEFLYQYMGHTCNVTCFDFNENVIVSGSGDNTVKYWPIEPEESSGIIHNPIRTEYDLIWPVKISIQPMGDDRDLVVVLCAHSICFMRVIENVEDFENETESFNFPFKVRIIEELRAYVDLNRVFDDYEDEATDYLLCNKSWIELNERMLCLYLVTDSNVRGKKKVFVRQYMLTVGQDVIDIDYVSSEYNKNGDEYFNIVNRIDKRIEVISVGLNFCLFVDDTNEFYLTNLKSKTTSNINVQLEPGTKVYRIMSNKTQEQFLLNSHEWLNGFNLTNSQVIDPQFVFYSSKRNQVFITKK